MTVRKLILLAGLGLWIAGPVMAQDASNKAQNQKLADSIAEKIRTSGVIKKGDGTKVSIEVRDGVVELSGTVASPEQHEQILRSVSKVSGIKRIESSMVGPLAPAMPVAERIPAPMAVAVVPAMPVAERIPAPMAATSPPPYAPVTRTGGQGEGGPLNALPAPLGAAPSAATGEPVPLNGAPMMTALDPAGPRLPPYAWPTYAPYNNMSRVAYPQSYPYNAFPYIGPYYPFPKVPLGWRKVVLEWEDGHWYYGKLASPQDMWRVKFW